MARNRSLLVKELSKKDSNEKVKDLLKQRINLQARYHLKPGNIVLTSYNAKFKEFTYDKTPLVLVLKRGRKYTLGLNFHWLPVTMRMYLVNHILKINKENIKNNKPLDFSYADLKPMLKKLGYAPCIRKYINARMGKQGVVIPPERLTEVARVKTESFTNGRYSANQLFQMAKNRGRKKAKASKKGRKK